MGQDQFHEGVDRIQNQFRDEFENEIDGVDPVVFATAISDVDELQDDVRYLDSEDDNETDLITDSFLNDFEKFADDVGGSESLVRINQDFEESINLTLNQISVQKVVQLTSDVSAYSSNVEEIVNMLSYESALNLDSETVFQISDLLFAYAEDALLDRVGFIQEDSPVKEIGLLYDCITEIASSANGLLSGVDFLGMLEGRINLLSRTAFPILLAGDNYEECLSLIQESPLVYKEALETIFLDADSTFLSAREAGIEETIYPLMRQVLEAREVQAQAEIIITEEEVPLIETYFHENVEPWLDGFILEASRPTTLAGVSYLERGRLEASNLSESLARIQSEAINSPNITTDIARAAIENIDDFVISQLIDSLGLEYFQRHENLRRILASYPDVRTYHFIRSIEDNNELVFALPPYSLTQGVSLSGIEDEGLFNSEVFGRLSEEDQLNLIQTLALETRNNNVQAVMEQYREEIPTWIIRILNAQEEFAKLDFTHDQSSASRLQYLDLIGYDNDFDQLSVMAAEALSAVLGISNIREFLVNWTTEQREAIYLAELNSITAILQLAGQNNTVGMLTSNRALHELEAGSPLANLNSYLGVMKRGIERGLSWEEAILNADEAGERVYGSDQTMNTFLVEYNEVFLSHPNRGSRRVALNRWIRDMDGGLFSSLFDSYNHSGLSAALIMSEYHDDIENIAEDQEEVRNAVAEFSFIQNHLRRDEIRSEIRNQLEETVDFNSLSEEEKEAHLDVVVGRSIESMISSYANNYVFSGIVGHHEAWASRYPGLQEAASQFLSANEMTNRVRAMEEGTGAFIAMAIAMAVALPVAVAVGAYASATYLGYQAATTASVFGMTLESSVIASTLGLVVEGAAFHTVQGVTEGAIDGDSETHWHDVFDLEHAGAGWVTGSAHAALTMGVLRMGGKLSAGLSPDQMAVGFEAMGQRMLATAVGMGVEVSLLAAMPIGQSLFTGSDVPPINELLVQNIMMSMYMRFLGRGVETLRDTAPVTQGGWEAFLRTPEAHSLIGESGFAGSDLVGGRFLFEGSSLLRNATMIESSGDSVPIAREGLGSDGGVILRTPEGRVYTTREIVEGVDLSELISTQFLTHQATMRAMSGELVSGSSMVSTSSVSEVIRDAASLNESRLPGESEVGYHCRRMADDIYRRFGDNFFVSNERLGAGSGGYHVGGEYESLGNGRVVWRPGEVVIGESTLLANDGAPHHIFMHELSHMNDYNLAREGRVSLLQGGRFESREGETLAAVRGDARDLYQTFISVSEVRSYFSDALISSSRLNRGGEIRGDDLAFNLRSNRFSRTSMLMGRLRQELGWTEFVAMENFRDGFRFEFDYHPEGAITLLKTTVGGDVCEMPLISRYDLEQARVLQSGIDPLSPAFVTARDNLAASVARTSHLQQVLSAEHEAVSYDLAVFLGRFSSDYEALDYSVLESGISSLESSMIKRNVGFIEDYVRSSVRFDGSLDRSFRLEVQLRDLDMQLRELSLGNEVLLGSLSSDLRQFLREGRESLRNTDIEEVATLLENNQQHELDLQNLTLELMSYGENQELRISDINTESRDMLGLDLSETFSISVLLERAQSLNVELDGRGVELEHLLLGLRGGVEATTLSRELRSVLEVNSNDTLTSLDLARVRSLSEEAYNRSNRIISERRMAQLSRSREILEIFNRGEEAAPFVTRVRESFDVTQEIEYDSLVQYFRGDVDHTFELNGRGFERDLQGDYPDLVLDVRFANGERGNLGLYLNESIVEIASIDMQGGRIETIEKFIMNDRWSEATVE